MIQFQSVSLQRGTKILLSSADLTIHAQQKWGLIGANGSGKSSLFKIFLGELQEDGGQALIPKQWRLSHMAQEVGTTDRTALDFIIDGDAELRHLEAKIAEEQNTSNGQNLAKLFERLEAMDGYTAEARAQKLLSGLGFKPGDDQRAVNDFSGGWRIRLNLAQALMCRSDLLLLDEPTNHLDLDATLWLESWLQHYPGTLLVISHDRDFLDNVVGGIVHLEHQVLTQYSGNYSSFEKQRAEKLAQQTQAFEKQQIRIAEIESFVRRFRAKATKAKQAQSRLKELERMEKIAPAHIDSPFSFQFELADKTSQTLVSISKGSIGYTPNKPIVDNIELSLLATSRIGLLGYNGAGKSTLIKTLANENPLLQGEKTEGANLKIGYFAQHQLEFLDLKASAALHIQRLSPNASEQSIRSFLGSFGFQGDAAFESIRHFSGGEKARLSLALIAWQKPNFLILDEPTNHLDLEVRHALTLALQNYEGAIIVVSHDRHLLKNTVDDFLLVADGKIQAFDGDLDDYQKWLADNRQDEPANHSGGSNHLNENNTLCKKEQRKQAAAQREKLKPLTNAIKKLEKRMEVLQEKLCHIEENLADSTIYEEQNKNTLANYLKEQSTLRTELEEIEMEWLGKSEELEELNTTKN